MRILVFSDLRPTFELPEVEADFIVLLGNIPGKVVNKICLTYECTIFGLHSNKCYKNLYDDTRVVPIHGKAIKINDLVIAGFSGIPTASYHEDIGSFGRYTENEAADFIGQLANTKVDIFFSYSNPKYGDLAVVGAMDGFSAFNQIILHSMVKDIVHGRLHYPNRRKMGDVVIHSVHSYEVIVL